MKQEIKQRQQRAYVLAGIGVSVVLVISIFLTLNFGSIGQTKADVTAVSVWTGDKNNDFLNPANWSTNQVPDISTRAVIDKITDKPIEIKRNDNVSIGELELKGGATLEIKGDLEIRKDAIIHSIGSKLFVEGKLLVAQSLFALSNSQITFSKGAKAYIDFDVIVENALIENEGAVIDIKRNLEIRRFGSRYVQNSGSTQIQFNMLLFGSSKTQNAFELKGGNTQIFGSINYLKENVNAINAGILKVSEGSLTINSVERNVVNDFYLPTKINLEINGGEIVFKNDLVFDTLTSENSIVKIGYGSSIWKDDKVYKRKDDNDVVKVHFSDNVYSLKQSKWNSEGAKPGIDNDWLYLGKVNEPDKSCNCLTVADWDKSKTYSRVNPDDEIFVKYSGIIYRMNKTATYSKSNTPNTNSWAWVKWYECLENQEFFSDILNINGGKVVFEGAWYHREGISTEQGSYVELAEGNSTFSLLEGDQIANLNILRDAQLVAKGKTHITGDITNHSELTIGDGGTVELSGNDVQLLKGSQPLVFEKLQIAKDSQDVFVYNNLLIEDSLIWKTPTPLRLQSVANNVSSRKETLVLFQENASYKGSGWVNGKVRKIGNTDFIYPVGAFGKAGPIALSKPSINSSYTVEYAVGYPPYLNNMANGVSTISALEYWSIETDYGDNSVIPTVYWMNSNWSCIESAKDLVVAGFNNTSWISIGNRFYKDKEVFGSVTAQKSIAKMQYFTFGSTSIVNPLNSVDAPFSIDNTEGGISLNWENMPDKPYTIELTKETGAGFVSLRSWKGKATDNFINLDFQDALQDNANYEICVYTENKIWKKKLSDSKEIENLKLDIYPNPFQDHFSIKFTSIQNETFNWSLLDVNGKTVYSESGSASIGDNVITYQNASNLKPGNYLIKATIGNRQLTERIVKN